MVEEKLVGMVLVLTLTVVVAEIIHLLTGTGPADVMARKQVVTVLLCKVVAEVIAHGGMAAAAEAILVVVADHVQVVVILLVAEAVQVI
jgi:hypothetical protein